MRCGKLEPWGKRMMNQRSTIERPRSSVYHLVMKTIYEAAGGDEGLRRLAKAWHARVLVDEVVGHAFRHGVHPEHTERLAAYWAEALGGPERFSEAYGDETSVVRMHSG